MVTHLNYGMVGGGLDAMIGEVHRKAIGFDNRATLVAGCFSRDPKRNAQTAQQYGLPEDRTYATYQEMAEKEAARPDGINFVSIVTPNHLHYEIAKAFLENGINVVCEKPLCFEVEQARELVALAKEKNLLFAVTYTYPGYAMVKVMREMVREGKIGDIVTVNAEYVQDWLLGQIAPGATGEASLPVWRMDPKYSGVSNCVGDIGTHIEYAVHYVTGLEIRRLLATVNRYGQQLDMNGNIIVEYDNGTNGAYWCSQVAAGKLNGLVIRVYGKEGSLEWEQHYPDYLRYTPRDQAPQLLSRGCGYLQENAAACSRLPAGHPEGLYVAFANIYRNYITALLDVMNGKEPSTMDFPKGEDGLRGVEFVHAVVRSADEGSRWVDFE